jgi:hypothetical protein
MKKVLLTVILSAAFGFCFAPINRGLVPPDQIQRESTEAERAAQQSNLPQIGNVGGPDSGPGQSGSGREGSSGDGSALATAMQQMEGAKQEEQAREALAIANQNLNAKAKGSPSYFLWAAVLGALGFGLVYGARKWADKAIPEPMTAKKAAKW